MPMINTQYTFRMAATAVSMLALVAASPALSAKGQGQAAPTPPNPADWIDITSWNYAELYDGWRATELLDAEAKGKSGETVGEIEDLIIGKDGEIKAAVIEGGGFMDIGDTHARIPWDKVERTKTNAVNLPFDEDDFNSDVLVDVDDYSAREGNYRLRELIGDTVRDGRGAGYGYVRDVIFSQDDMAEAVIVNPDYTYGYGGSHPVPYSATGYRPYVADYWVPYMVKDLSQITPFEEERLTN